MRVSSFMDAHEVASLGARPIVDSCASRRDVEVDVLGMREMKVLEILQLPSLDQLGGACLI